VSIIELAAFASCTFSVGTLIFCERQLDDPEVHAHPAAKQLEWRRRVSKIAASMAFVLLAAPAVTKGAFGAWMVFGIVAGAIGDIALLGKGVRAFVIGLVAFLVGHVAYIVGLAQIEPMSMWIGLAGVATALPVIAAIFAMAQLWPKLGGLKGPVLVYVVAIVAMVVGAFATRFDLGLAMPIGAALFFASDLAVARDRFIARDFQNKLYGLPAYYLGQLLIAYSIRNYFF
jgi:uncharacterized membrane protein YhhN